MQRCLERISLVAVLALLAACSSRESAVVPPTSSGFGPAGAQSAGRITGALPANVRRVCEDVHVPGSMHCDALVRVDAGGTPNANVAGYGPADLQAAYALPSSTNGSGQTIAIVDAFGYPAAVQDLAKYRAQFGLPACTPANGCFKKVNQNGQNGNYPPPNQGWEQEQALDLDMVSAACPNCNILLVQASHATSKSLGRSVDTAVRLGANVVSNSYGGSGGAGASHYDHPGVVIVASSGDSGYGTQVPAGYPTVVSVGGTHLAKIGSGRGWNEKAWIGTGSGCTVYAKPSWQSDSGCDKRTMNDVAAVADPATGVAVFWKSGWFVYGGTSVSTPLIAAVYGLAGNASSIDAAESLYQNPAQLFDVTSGSNGTCTPTYLCTAGPGYDGPTGNGTPNGIGAF